MSKLFDNLAKDTGNQLSTRASEGLPAGDVDSYIDTGSYTLNALLSGSIFGGMPNNKILAIAGEEATGKTFFALGIMKNFLELNKTGAVFYFESEGALTKDILESRNIDTDRVHIFPVTTIQEFRHQAVSVANGYIEHANPPPLMMVLDSLGNLSTTKEVTDMESGAETRDMTRTQLIRGAFRVLNLKLSIAKIPFILTNHTYQTMGMFATQEMSGGGGVKYAASQIVFLSKKKDRDKDKTLVGNIIKCKLDKSRFTREGKIIETKLSFETGLNPYFGLIDIALNAGIWKKVGKKIEVGKDKSHFEKHIYDNPKKFFTESVMNKIDEACGKEFKYGT